MSPRAPGREAATRERSRDASRATARDGEEREPTRDAMRPAVRRALQSPGEPMDSRTRGEMETRFGHDFGRIRVHRDNDAATAARAIDADAFASGRHIVFGEGRYRPESNEGRRLLAHELTHSVQQSSAPESVSAPGTIQRSTLVSRPSDAQEREADAVGALVASGGVVPAGMVTPRPVEAPAVLARQAASATLEPPADVELAVKDAEAAVEEDAEDRSGRAQRELEQLDPSAAAGARARVRGRARELGGPDLRPARAAEPAADAKVDEASGKRAPKSTAPMPTLMPATAAPAASTSNAASRTTPTRVADVPTTARADDDARANAPNKRVVPAEPVPQESAVAADGESTRADGELAEADAEAVPNVAELVAAPAPANAMPDAETTADTETAVTEEEAAAAREQVAGLADALADHAKEVQGRIRAQTRLSTRAVERQGDALREGTKTSIGAAIASTNSAAKANREELDISLETARREMQVAFAEREKEAGKEGERSRTKMDSVFYAVDAGMDMAFMRAESRTVLLSSSYANKVRGETAARRLEVSQRSKKQFFSYPDTERGLAQGLAASQVAAGVAKEIEAMEPDIQQALVDVMEGIPEKFRDERIARLTELEEARVDLLPQITYYASSVQGSMSDQEEAALASLNSIRDQIAEGIEVGRSGMVARLNALLAETAAGIDTAVQTSVGRIEAAGARASRRIGGITTDAAALLRETEAPDVDASTEFVAQIQEFADGGAEVAVDALRQAAAALGAHFRKSRSAVDQTLRDEEKRFAAHLAAADASQAAAFPKMIAETDRQLGEEIETERAKLRAFEDDLTPKLMKGLAEIRSGIDSMLAQTELELQKIVAQGLAKEDEALSLLDGKMAEAAAQAAWDVDHWVLAGLRDTGAFIAGLVWGVVKVFAIVILVIVAIKLAVAGLIILGLSAAAAAIVVAIVSIAAMGYFVYKAYEQRVAAGEEGGWGTFGLAVLDQTGVTQLARGLDFSNDMTPFERGQSIGEGGATIASFFIGKRLNKAIDAKLPHSIVSPRRGALLPESLKKKWGIPPDPWLAEQGVRPKPGERLTTKAEYKAEQSRLRYEARQQSAASVAESGAGDARVPAETPSNVISLESERLARQGDVVPDQGPKELGKPADVINLAERKAAAAERQPPPDSEPHLQSKEAANDNVELVEAEMKQAANAGRGGGVRTGDVPRDPTVAMAGERKGSGSGGGKVSERPKPGSGGKLTPVRERPINPKRVREPDEFRFEPESEPKRYTPEELIEGGDEGSMYEQVESLADEMRAKSKDPNAPRNLDARLGQIMEKPSFAQRVEKLGSTFEPVHQSRWKSKEFGWLRKIFKGNERPDGIAISTKRKEIVIGDVLMSTDNLRAPEAGTYIAKHWATTKGFYAEIFRHDPYVLQNFKGWTLRVYDWPVTHGDPVNSAVFIIGE